MEKLAKQKRFQYTIVIFIAVICTVIPALAPKGDGYEENDIDTYKDCWVKGWSQYLFIICISISLIVHYMDISNIA